MTVSIKTTATIITSAYEAGKSKSAIEGHLQYEYGLSVNEAKKRVQKVLGKSAVTNSDWSETIQEIRKSFGKIDKKDLIDRMCAVKNAKFSSMNHAYNYIRFAQEYARQEVEAYKESIKK